MSENDPSNKEGEGDPFGFSEAFSDKGENKEPNGGQLDSEAEILSEMGDDFDPDAAAERVKEKKEELAEESEETEPNEELERVDEQINKDIAEDIGTEKITIEKTEDVVEEESEAIVEEVVFDAERAVDGKQFERFFTLEEEKEIYANALKEDVAKFERLLADEEEGLAEEQAKKLGLLDFSGRSSKRFAINAINGVIAEYKQKLEKAQKRLDEVDTLSSKEISKKLDDWVQGDVRAAWSVIYDNEKNSYRYHKKDEMSAWRAEQSALKVANSRPLLERTRWKEYGFMKGKFSKDQFGNVVYIPGKLYKPVNDEYTPVKDDPEGQERADAEYAEYAKKVHIPSSHDEEFEKIVSEIVDGQNDKPQEENDSSEGIA